jgi:putative ABC transport system permease protein
MYQNRVKIDINEDNINKEYKDILDANLEKETKEGKTFYKMVNTELNFPGDSYIENINLIDGEFDKQRAIEENGVILVNKSFYREKYKKGEITLTNYKVGDTIKVSIDDFNTNETFEAYLKIMAITEDKIIKSDNYKYVGLDFITYDEVSNNLGMTLDKNSIYIDSSEKNLDNIIEIATKNSWSYINQIEEYKALNQEITVISIFVYGFIAVISLVSATNIINTISTNIILRKRELAIIKSIGVDKFGFNRMIYLESILYALTSLIYGISFGAIFSLLMNFIIGDIVVFDIILPIKAIIISIFAVFIIVFVSAYIPMRKLNDKNIIENILKENI